MNAERAAAEDVGVDHGRAHVPVAEKGLDGADIGACLEEMGGETLAQGGQGRLDLTRDRHRPNP